MNGEAAAALDRRLAPGLAAPVAVAFSGGGDSLAALIATLAWAGRHGRRVLALHVDHGLQAASPAWAAFAAATAMRLGAGFARLDWTGPKPARGLAAAARDARHRLLAEAVREAGASVIVTGHTADDVLEGAVMRGWGSTLGALREWSPSPAWPEGRGVFLLRPLLGLRRAALRERLGRLSERWIDDPANADPAQTRARARLVLANGGGGAPPAPAADEAGLAQLARAVEPLAGGALGIGRAALAEAAASAGRRLLGAAALCAGGGARPPRGERVRALHARLAAPGPVAATLCGARIVADAAGVVIARDAGEAARGGLAPLALEPGRPVVWDGRIELAALEPGLCVRPLAGRAARLPAAERAALRLAPAPARPALPVVEGPGGAPTCPFLAEGPAAARALAWDRLRAACGAISKEPAA